MLIKGTSYHRMLDNRFAPYSGLPATCATGTVPRAAGGCRGRRSRPAIRPAAGARRPRRPSTAGPSTTFLAVGRQRDVVVRPQFASLDGLAPEAVHAPGVEPSQGPEVQARQLLHAGDRHLIGPRHVDRRLLDGLAEQRLLADD